MRGHRRLGAWIVSLSLWVGATGVALAVPGPNATNDTDYATLEDTPKVVGAPGILANDGTAGDGNILCVGSVDTSSLHGTLGWAADGSFTYTPTANYNGAGTGNSFTYTMYEVAALPCQGDTGSTARVEITVTPVNDPPTAAADSFGVVKNVTLNVAAPGVLRNDADVDGDSLTAVKVSNPSHGVVILAADGSFSYTPTTGYVGPDAFSYRASDGTAASPTRVVSLTVTAIPPIATPTPVPTPAPTPTPIATPSPSIAPAPSPEVSASPGPSASPAATAGPSGSPSASPRSSQEPGPVDSEGGGISLPVLLVIILFVLLVGFGAALYIPKWLAAQRGEPTDLD